MVQIIHKINGTCIWQVSGSRGEGGAAYSNAWVS